MSARQVADFQLLFSSKEAVFRHAVEGKLRKSSVRSITWRYFLGTLRLPIASFPDLAASEAANYASLREEYCPDPRDAADDVEDLSISHPLSTHESSPWRDFFEDSELRSEILKDLERLYVGDEFFERPSVRDQLLRILFIWSRINPQLSYRQGMHELLAPFLLLISTDAVEATGDGAAVGDVAGDGGGDDESRKLIAQVLRLEHVEAGAFSAFR